MSIDSENSAEENSSSDKDVATESETVTIDISKAVEEAQLLVVYISNEGLDVEPEIIKKIVESKYLLRNKKWTPETEFNFWMAYNTLASIVKPVTINSLKSIKPLSKSGKKKVKSKARKAVFQYRMFAVCALAALLAIQIYWLIGTSATTKLKTLFSEKVALKLEIEKIKNLKGLNLVKARIDNIAVDEKVHTHDPDLERLGAKITTIQQEQDAHYELLRSWNKVWLAVMNKDEFDGKVRNYFAFKLRREKEQIVNNIKKIEAQKVKNADTGSALKALYKKKMDLELQLQHNKSRNRLFLNKIAAGYVTETIQMYFLPLLYGLLGACMFVLRSLSREIKELTYTAESDINYRLRITTGALAGLSIGWFLTPDSDKALSGLSTFALSFLCGYSVEVLFSLMDKIISNIVKKKPAEPANDKAALLKRVR